MILHCCLAALHCLDVTPINHRIFGRTIVANVVGHWIDGWLHWRLYLEVDDTTLLTIDRFLTVHEVLDAYTRFWTHTRGSGRIHGVLDAYMEFLNCWLTTSRVDAFIRKLTHRRNCCWRYSWRRDELNCLGEHYGMLLCCLNAILLVEHYSVGWICGPFWCLIWKSTHVRVSERIEKTVVDDILLRCRCEHHWMSLCWWNPPPVLCNVDAWLKRKLRHIRVSEAAVYDIQNSWQYSWQFKEALGTIVDDITKLNVRTAVYLPLRTLADTVRLIRPAACIDAWSENVTHIRVAEHVEKAVVDPVQSHRRYTKFLAPLTKYEALEDILTCSWWNAKLLTICEVLVDLRSHWKYPMPLTVYKAIENIRSHWWYMKLLIRWNARMVRVVVTFLLRTW